MNSLHAAAQTACQQIGVIYQDKPADGGFHALDVEGKATRNGAGRIRLYPDGEGGQVWNHVTTDTLQFWAKSNQTFTPAEAAAKRQQREEDNRQAEALLAEERSGAAKLAGQVWKVAGPVLDSVYFNRKGVTPTDTLKEIALSGLVKMIDYTPAVRGEFFTGSKVLIAPVFDGTKITTIEMISEKGLKAGLKGGQKKGGFWSSHKLPDGDGTGLVIGIGEGVSTMLTYNMAGGNIGIAALSCGNMAAVGKYFRNRYPAARIEIVSDVGNGEASAIEAALAVAGYLIKPTFPDGSTETDINDLHAESGIQAVKDCLQAAAMVDPIPTPAPISDNPLTAAVDRMAKLSPLEYDRVRKKEAEALGVRPGTLDAAIKAARKEEESADTPFHEVELWPEPVDGAALITELVATIRRFIICEMHTAVAAALWVVMSWLMEVVMVAPLALITAPEKRCGKTLLLTLIGKLTPRPLTSSSITPSALFRSIDLWKPTLLIDEVDACLKDNEELRGLINSGHTRDSAYTIRCVGDDHTPTKFNTWAAKALSGIGHPADTLLDRSIILELRRKLPSEKVERIRHAGADLFNELSAKLARFAEDNTEAARAARPTLPHTLNDRQQDNWEPLLAIAMVAGGEWFKTATAAALKLSGGETLSPTIGAELLADIQEIFQNQNFDRVSTTDLIKFLVADDERPWRTFSRGFQITPRQVSKKLGEYSIHSGDVRFGTQVLKGYKKEQFTEAFLRYVQTPPLTNATTLQTASIVGLADFSKRNSNVYVADIKTCETASIKDCSVVADKIPLNGNEEVFEEVFDLTGTTFEVMT